MGASPRVGKVHLPRRRGRAAFLVVVAVPEIRPFVEVRRVVNEPVEPVERTRARRTSPRRLRRRRPPRTGPGVGGAVLAPGRPRRCRAPLPPRFRAVPPERCVSSPSAPCLSRRHHWHRRPPHLLGSQNTPWRSCFGAGGPELAPISVRQNLSLRHSDEQLDKLAGVLRRVEPISDEFGCSDTEPAAQRGLFDEHPQRVHEGVTVTGRDDRPVCPIAHDLRHTRDRCPDERQLGGTRLEQGDAEAVGASRKGEDVGLVIQGDQFGRVRRQRAMNVNTWSTGDLRSR